MHGKKAFLYSCIPLSLRLPLTSVSFCVTWLIWAWKITHDKSPGWLDLSHALSLFFVLSLPPLPSNLFSPMKGKGFPSCLYMVRVERSCSAVWQECVCLRLNRKCAAFTTTTLFPLTGSGLLCLIQQLLLAMGVFVSVHMSVFSVYFCNAESFKRLWFSTMCFVQVTVWCGCRPQYWLYWSIYSLELKM